MAGRRTCPRLNRKNRDLLDQWLLAELHKLVKVVTDAFEDYDAVNATRPIEDFVERLSNWYVRLSRDRFWKSEVDDSKRSAYATLYETLCTLAQLLAPTMPFLSEEMYRNLVAEQFQACRKACICRNGASMTRRC